MATRSREGGRIKAYTAEEIVLATDNFSWQLRSESVGIWGSVYKGYIDSNAVSAKFLNSHLEPHILFGYIEEPHFDSMVQCLRQIGHPHLLSMLGFCSELKCFVYEHIDYSRSLQEVVKKNNLQWQDRIRIASDICSALCYIKRARCEPIVPDYLNASNILIDSHLKAKVNPVLKKRDYKLDSAWDVKTFGYLVLNLLTGIPGNFFSYCYIRWCVGLPRALDKTSGQWPMDLAEKLMNVCQRCVDCNPRDEFRKKHIMVIIVKEMNELREKADETVSGRAGTNDLLTSGKDPKLQNSDIPRQFYCPIYMEVMEDPHVAADGFSYEKKGIEKWLQTGHDTSPVTNLKLDNKTLTPNGTLKLLIKDWYRERSNPHLYP